MPFDPMIANYNVRNCKELGGKAGPIDVAYLQQLGPDALPAMTHLIENLPPKYGNARPGHTLYGQGSRAYYEPIDYDRRGHFPSDDATLREQLLHIRGSLSDELGEQLDGWRGWTVRRAWLQSEIE